MHISTKCSVAIHCLLFIYEYGESKKVTSHLLSLSTGVNAVTIRNILSALKKDEIVSVKNGTGGTTLNCSPAQIDLYRVTKAIEPDFESKLIGVHAFPSPLCPIGKNIHKVLNHSYDQIREDLCRSLKNITLEDIIKDYQNCRNQDEKNQI